MFNPIKIFKDYWADMLLWHEATKPFEEDEEEIEHEEERIRYEEYING